MGYVRIVGSYPVTDILRASLIRGFVTRRIKCTIRIGRVSGWYTMTEPTWQHDCKRCRYLATVHIDGETVDWYTCVSSAIGRYGDEGSQYWSMPRAMLQQAADHGSSFASAALEVTRND